MMSRDFFLQPQASQLQCTRLLRCVHFTVEVGAEFGICFHDLLLCQTHGLLTQIVPLLLHWLQATAGLEFRVDRP